MIQIFKIKIKGDDIVEAIHFETQEAAEALMNTFGEMTDKGKKIEWECTIVNVLSKQDAFDQFIDILKEFPE